MNGLRRSSVVIAMLATVVVGLGSPGAPSEPALEQDFLTLINAERSSAGLTPLRPYWDLEDDAVSHSITMMSGDWLHHNPDLGSVTTGWWSLGENVGVGPSVSSLHTAFMNSPGHAANVLGDYNYVGIGVEREGPTKMWVTVVFMRGPEGLVPEPSQTPLPTTNAELAPEATNVGVVDSGTGRWYLRAGSGDSRSFLYGDPGDYPMLGDWDCDGVDTPGLYRQKDGYVYLRNSSTEGAADYRFYFGNPQDIPVAGDFDGDGCDTVAVYRPDEARVYIINRLGNGNEGLGAADYWLPVGGVGREVVAADFDGDGVDTVTEVVGSGVVAGDWNVDGQETLGHFNDVAGHFTLGGPSGNAFSQFYFGNPGWLPVGGEADLS